MKYAKQSARSMARERDDLSIDPPAFCVPNLCGRDRPLQREGAGASVCNAGALSGDTHRAPTSMAKSPDMLCEVGAYA